MNRRRRRERGFIVSRKEIITTGFAGIFSNNVIEHLLRPVDEFRYFHRILAPSGLMAHASPCYQYCYEFSRFDAPHVLAERSGFRVIHYEEDGESRNCVFQRSNRTWWSNNRATERVARIIAATRPDATLALRYTIGGRFGA
jgi:hypothetical protein